MAEIGGIECKRGQFYLIAAIIISAIVLSIAGLSNYARGQELRNMQDVGDELRIESEKVLDFGTYNSYSESQMQALMETFSTNYISHASEGGDYYFLFGTSSQIKVLGYSESDITIYVNAGAGEISINLDRDEIKSQDFTPQSGTITLTIDGTAYDFELKDGQNFYFVVSREIGGEKHVARN